MAKFKIPPPPIGSTDSSVWSNWYITMKNAINQAFDSLTWTLINFTGSKIVDIVDRKHNDLTNMQGGSSAQFFHLTSAQHTGLTGGGNADAYHNHTGIGSGVSVVVTTAALTGGGAQGSMTFTNGVLTAQTQAT